MFETLLTFRSCALPIVSFLVSRKKKESKKVEKKISKKEKEVDKNKRGQAGVFETSEDFQLYALLFRTLAGIELSIPVAPLPIGKK